MSFSSSQKYGSVDLPLTQKTLDDTTPSGTLDTTSPVFIGIGDIVKVGNRFPSISDTSKLTLFATYNPCLENRQDLM